MQRKPAVENRGYEVAGIVFRFEIREATGGFAVLLAGIASSTACNKVPASTYLREKVPGLFFLEEK